MNPHEVNQNGINGAIKIGKKLYCLHKNDRKIDCVYASPLKRAKQTAKLIMDQFTDSNEKLEINFDERIMERHHGDLQGQTMADLKEKEPEIYENLVSNISWKPSGDKAESLLDVNNRCIQFLAQIASKHHGKRILIITHGGVLHTIFNDILHGNCVSHKRFYCKNCAINIIKREPANGTWYISVLGDDDYGNYQEQSMVTNVNTSNNNMTSLCIGVMIGCLFGYSAFKWCRQ